jgi:uncharacterized membrane protein YebE (DUF533 family)
LDGGVLRGGPVARALAGRAGAARAAGTADFVLRGRLVAGALHGGLLAAGAGRLLGTGTLGIALAAAGSRLGDSHFEVWGKMSVVKNGVMVFEK